MAFDFDPQDGGDKGHHKKSHTDAHSKLHNEVHGLFDKIHHGIQKAKPHIDHIAHGVGHTFEKEVGGTVKREFNGTATPSDKHKVETAGKIAAVVLLPHVTIGGAAVKEGIKLVKHASQNSHTNVHVEVHTPVKHGGSKM